MSDIPTRWRKKPVVIEAMRIVGYTMLLSPAQGGGQEGGDIWRWVTNNGGELHVDQLDPGPVYGIIVTLEGPMRANVGDWIIRGVRGEFYPCKPDIFKATYEASE